MSGVERGRLVLHSWSRWTGGVVAALLTASGAAVAALAANGGWLATGRAGSPRTDGVAREIGRTWDTVEDEMRLEIVVAPGCRGCTEARAIARELHALYPELTVELIELDGRRPPPTQVVATPTYLLDGHVIALGNPRCEELMQVIARYRASEW